MMKTHLSSRSSRSDRSHAVVSKAANARRLKLNDISNQPLIYEYLPWQTWTQLSKVSKSFHHWDQRLPHWQRHFKLYFPYIQDPYAFRCSSEVGRMGSFKAIDLTNTLRTCWFSARLDPKLLFGTYHYIESRTLSDLETRVWSWAKSGRLGDEVKVQLRLPNAADAWCVPDSTGKTALDWARINGHQALLNYFFKCVYESAYGSGDLANADPNRLIQGQTLFIWALQCHQIALVKRLCAVGNSPLANPNHLLALVKKMPFEISKTILDTFKIPPVQDEYSKEPNTRTMLLWAALPGDLRLLKYLIEVKQLDPGLLSLGAPPETNAFACASPTILKYLLRHWQVTPVHAFRIFKQALANQHFAAATVWVSKLTFNKNSDTNTPANDTIHLAAKAGALDVVAAILNKAPFLLEYLNASGDTPLLTAVKNYQFKVIAYLIDQNANFCAKDGEAFSVLDLAIEGPYLVNDMPNFLPDVVDWIALKPDGVEAITDPSAAILERIGEFGNLRIIKTVLKCYQDKHLLTAPLLEKVLRFAIVFNFLPVAAHLIKCYPYNLDTLACYSEMRDTFVRQTPLEYATARGSVEMIDLLLRAGASPYVDLTDQKQHVIALAIRRGDIDLIKLIVSHDKQALKARGLRGETVLHWAVQYGHTHVIQYALAQENEIDLRTRLHCPKHPDHDKTAMCLAIERGALDDYHLLKSDALLNQTIGDREDYPIHLAIRHYQFKCLTQIVTEAPWTLRQTNDLGQTPLLLAQSLGLTKMVNFLSAAAKPASPTLTRVPTPASALLRTPALSRPQPVPAPASEPPPSVGDFNPLPIALFQNILHTYFSFPELLRIAHLCQTVHTISQAPQYWRSRREIYFSPQLNPIFHMSSYSARQQLPKHLLTITLSEFTLFALHYLMEDTKDFNLPERNRVSRIWHTAIVENDLTFIQAKAKLYKKTPAVFLAQLCKHSKRTIIPRAFDHTPKIKHFYIKEVDELLYHGHQRILDCIFQVVCAAWGLSDEDIRQVVCDRPRNLGDNIATLSLFRWAVWLNQISHVTTLLASGQFLGDPLQSVAQGIRDARCVAMVRTLIEASPEILERKSTYFKVPLFTYAKETVTEKQWDDKFQYLFQVEQEIDPKFIHTISNPSMALLPTLVRYHRWDSLHFVHAQMADGWHWDPLVLNPNSPFFQKTPLYLALEMKKLDMARSLIEYGADVTASVPHKSHVVHLVVAAGDLSLLKQILAKHPELIYKKNNAHCTPFATALWFGHKAIVSYLLNAYPDMDLTSDLGLLKHLPVTHFDRSTSQHRRPRLDYLRLLAQHNLPFEVTKYYVNLIKQLVESGDLCGLKIVLQGKPASFIRTFNDKTGYGLLMTAAKKGHAHVVKYLIQQYPLLNLEASTHCPELHKTGYTALAYAVKQGHTRVAQTLLDAGAQTTVYWRGKHESLVVFAVKLGHIDILKVLLTRHLKDRDLLCEALQVAVKYGQLEIVEYLLRLPQDVLNQRHDSGDPNPGPAAVCLAIQVGHLAVLKALLDQEPRLLMRPLPGGVGYPVHLAVTKRRLEILAYLVKQSTRVLTQKNQAQETPLVLAEREGFKAGVAYLQRVARVPQPGVFFNAPNATRAESDEGAERSNRCQALTACFRRCLMQ